MCHRGDRKLGLRDRKGCQVEVGLWERGRVLFGIRFGIV